MTVWVAGLGRDRNGSSGWFPARPLSTDVVAEVVRARIEKAVITLRYGNRVGLIRCSLNSAAW